MSYALLIPFEPVPERRVVLGDRVLHEALACPTRVGRGVEGKPIAAS